MGVSYEVLVVNYPFGPTFFESTLVHFVEGVIAQFLRKFQSCVFLYMRERVITLEPCLTIYIKNWCQWRWKILYLFRRKTVSIDHRYAFERAKQDASVHIVKAYKKLLDVKSLKATMYGYTGQNVCMTTNKSDIRNFFSIQVKAKKKCAETCKNIWAFF